jgi:hypothetical protein
MAPAASIARGPARPRRPVGRWALPGLLALTALGWALSARADDARTLERIVAVVDKDVITEGELRAEARLALVLRHGEAGATAPLDGAYVQAFVDHLISQVLVAQEARRMGAAGAAEVEVNARMALLAGQFATPTAYRTFMDSLTMDGDFVRAVLARDVQNDRYIAQRLRTRLLAQPKQALPGAGQADERARHEALQGWLAELRRAAQVRVLDDAGLLHLERH